MSRLVAPHGKDPLGAGEAVAASSAPSASSRRRVDRARTLYPFVWDRIREACVWAADGFDVDDHCARIVLAVTEGAR